MIELLVTVAVIGVLISVLLPALGSARESAHTIACASNQRQLVTGWRSYANQSKDRAMPLAYTDLADVGTGDSIFWWGSAGNATGAIDLNRGFLSPHVEPSRGASSVYECPSQPPGTYRPQGSTGETSTTYGYNGYYLSPPKTPGWSFTIGHQRWKRVAEIPNPSTLLVFADTLLAGSRPSSTSLLDPPMLYQGDGEWRENFAPTTSFRHQRSGSNGSCNGAHADGSVQAQRAQPEWIVNQTHAIGSIGTENGPRYVPDWARWSGP